MTVLYKDQKVELYQGDTKLITIPGRVYSEGPALHTLIYGKGLNARGFNFDRMIDLHSGIEYRDVEIKKRSKARAFTFTAQVVNHSLNEYNQEDNSL